MNEVLTYKMNEINTHIDTSILDKLLVTQSNVRTHNNQSSASFESPTLTTSIDSVAAGYT